MERFRQWILPVLAVVLILGAAMTVLLLSRPHIGDLLSFTGRPPSQSPLSDGESARSVTYRFLFPGEAHAAPGKLTLGRFADGHLCEGATWEFDSIDQWHGWASAIFARERHWTPEEQPGWRISRWLVENIDSAYDCDHLFWGIQALQYLDPDSFANEIDMIEHSGGTVRVVLTEGPSDYDYDTDTLYWSPTANPDPLVALAHELSHAWHDLCRDGDAVAHKGREKLALLAENRIRHILFLKDPTRSHLYPRLGRPETPPDIMEDSPRKAWDNYRNAIAR